MLEIGDEVEVLSADDEWFIGKRGITTEMRGPYFTVEFHEKRAVVGAAAGYTPVVWVWTEAGLRLVETEYNHGIRILGEDYFA